MSLAVSHLSKTFGPHRAVDDVSLRVGDGELVALLGPSGCGKTTLLRMIAGLEEPDPHPAASLRFDDREVAGEAVGRREVGFVFQHYALFRQLTVFENVAFGLRVKPWRERPPRAEIRERVLELLRLVQLEGFEQRLPGQLSGGQRQRVALARALAVRPRVLLLDEPFGALDAKVRADLRRWLRRLHDELHVTSLFVTHDQEEALEVADRVVVMQRGRVEQDGSPDEVFHHPANAFVTDFLGQVNLFHGRVQDGQAVFGPLAVDSPPAAEGQAARLLVRPHELEIHPARVGRPGLAATVARLQLAGPLAKVELRGDGPDEIVVSLSHEQVATLGLRVGDAVTVGLKGHRVYVDDYSI
ncbi:MAG: TOBE-like domain-containing protein [Fimbriimonadaceae bacterium]|nr:TOBE-like domain-containing protein [Fimbriimonadaceae bacterium]